MSEPVFDVVIQSIIIGDRMIEISYQEERDQSAYVMQVRTLAVEQSMVPEEVGDLLDSARAVVDAALLLHRSPSIESKGARIID